MSTYEFEYMFDLATAEPVASNNIRFNNTNAQLVTKIWIHDMSSLGKDNSKIFTFMQNTGLMYIQEKDDATKWQSFNLVGPLADKGVYTEFPVTWRGGGATLLAQRSSLIFDNSPIASAVPGPIRGWIEVQGYSMDARKPNLPAAINVSNIVSVRKITPDSCYIHVKSEVDYHIAETYEAVMTKIGASL